MQIEVVSPFMIDQVWHNIASDVQTALKRTGGQATPDLLWKSCRTGASNLIVFHEGNKPRFYGIVTFETWNGDRICHANLICGADLATWQTELSTLKSWAKSHGAKAVIMSGSKAYRRVFPEAKTLMTIYRMEID